MKATFISDLHGDMPKLKGGDLLIVAGDLTAHDKEIQYKKFSEWVISQDYRHIVIVAGNHDCYVQNNTCCFDVGMLGGAATYLCDSGTEIEYEETVEEEHKFKGLISYQVKRKLKIWGSPWTPYFDGVNPDCSAFMIRSDYVLKDKFDLIPEDTDILVTHGPCFGRLDLTLDGDNAGSPALRTRVDYLRDKMFLKYHIHGHIHEAYGMHDEGGLKTFNVARMDRSYRPKNSIVNIEI